MATTTKLNYKQWLAANKLSSSKANAKKWNALRPPRPTARASAPAPNYASATDPLATPYGSQMIWHGKVAPNLKSLSGGAFGQLTPLTGANGGYEVWGVPTDLTPQWAKDEMGAITSRGQKAYNDATTRVMPWLANQLASLQSVQGQGTTNFANMAGQASANIANAVSQAGPGAQFAGSPALAPFQVSEGLSHSLAQQQAGSQQGAASYQAALANLSGTNTAAGLNAALAQQVAAIPDKYDQQVHAFMQQLGPLLSQLQQSQQQGEFQRRQAIEQRRQFNESNRVEAAIAGIKADASVTAAQTRADSQAQARAATAARQDATDNFRSVAQIRSSVNQGETLLDNGGSGFKAKQAWTKWHGLPVTWEQARNGNWYAVAGKPASGSGSGSGGGNSLKGRQQGVNLATQLWGKMTDVLATQKDVDAGRATSVGQTIKKKRQYDPVTIWRLLLRRGLSGKIAAGIVQDVTGTAIAYQLPGTPGGAAGPKAPTR